MRVEILKITLQKRKREKIMKSPEEEEEEEEEVNIVNADGGFMSRITDFGGAHPEKGLLVENSALEK